MAEGGNSKAAIVVALIGGAATILAVVIPKVFFPEKEHQPAAFVVSQTASVQPPLRTDVHAGDGSSNTRKPANLLEGKTLDGPSAAQSNRRYLERGKDYLAGQRYSDALSAFKQVTVTGPGAAKWHVCVGSVAVVAGDPATASKEFEAAAELGEKGMYEISKRVADDAEEIKLDAAVKDPQELTDEHWAAYKVLLDSGIPGTGEIQMKIRYLLAQKDSNESKWIDRHQESMSEVGTLRRGCD